jgi:CheY-like chemotaxis protein
MSPVPPETSATETLLVVENEAAVRNLLEVALRKNGYTVLAAGSGSEALEVIRQHHGTIHLLITDVMMPDMDGPELARLVATLRPHTPTLFMSGYMDDTLDERGIRFATANFIQKPFSPSTLARKVREILDGVAR